MDGHYGSDWVRLFDNHRVQAAPRRFFPSRAPKLTQRMGTGSPVPSTNEKTGHHNLVCSEKAPGTPGLSRVDMNRLLDLDHAAALRGLSSLTRSTTWRANLNSERACGDWS